MLFLQKKTQQKLTEKHKSTYHDSKWIVRINGRESDWFSIKKGIRQEIARAMSFSLYMDDILMWNMNIVPDTSNDIRGRYCSYRLYQIESRASYNWMRSWAGREKNVHKYRKRQNNEHSSGLSFQTNKYILLHCHSRKVWETDQPHTNNILVIPTPTQ